jgi:hypothetical protein
VHSFVADMETASVHSFVADMDTASVHSFVEGMETAVVHSFVADMETAASLVDSFAYVNNLDILAGDNGEIVGILRAAEGTSEGLEGTFGELVVDLHKLVEGSEIVHHNDNMVVEVEVVDPLKIKF